MTEHEADDKLRLVQPDSESEQELVRLFQTVWRYGLCFVKNVPSELTESEANSLSCVALLAKRTSFLRQTNYGKVFNVKSKLNANNQAYTNQSLSLHTDLPYYTVAPDVQILHCVHPSPADLGGESMFCDGVAAALKLKEQVCKGD